VKIIVGIEEKVNIIVGIIVVEVEEKKVKK